MPRGCLWGLYCAVPGSKVLRVAFAATCVDPIWQDEVVFGFVCVRLIERGIWFCRSPSSAVTQKAALGASCLSPLSALPCGTERLDGDGGWVMNCRTTSVSGAVDKPGAWRGAPFCRRSKGRDRYRGR